MERIHWREAEAALGHRVHDRRWAFYRHDGRIVTVAEPVQTLDASMVRVTYVDHDTRVTQVPIRDANMAALYTRAIAEGICRNESGT